MMATPNRPQLVFSSTEELREELDKAIACGGVEQLVRKVSEEFNPGRQLVVGENSWVIHAVQVRCLDSGEPAGVLFDYAEESTAENSRLALIVNLVNADPSVQLVVRRRLQP
jgi:hypothetical protein